MSAPNLEYVNGASFYVYDGSTLTLPSVTSYSVNSPADGSWDRRYFKAEGVGSMIDLSSLESLIDNNSYGGLSTLRVTSGSELIAPKLTTLQYVSLSLGRGSIFSVGQLESFTWGDINLYDETYTFSSLSYRIFGEWYS